MSRVVVSGPLAPFAGAYAAELRSRGYTPLTTVNELRLMARLSRWLDAGGLAAGDLNAECVEQLLAVQRAQGRRGACSRPALMCLLDVLGGLGLLAVEQSVPGGSPDELLLASFERYLLGERGLGSRTAAGYVGHARRFLTGLSSGGLPGLSASEVTGAVLRESAAVSVSAAQNFICGLRSFLRFCFIEGIVEADLSRAALSLTGRRSSPLPKGISHADAAALLGSCDRRSAIGRRDYAVIITLLRLGLRRSEVAPLTLDDIDWRRGELVVHGKGGREDRLPVPADVGEAIAGYLRRGRPASDRREVFLRARAPIRPLAPGTVSSTVRRAAEPGSRRSERIACAIRSPARWSPPKSRCPRSARCCVIAACRAQQSTRAGTSISSGSWRSRGRERQGERAR